MRISDVVRLLVLAALWGGSFIFMRVIAPVLGPLGTADFRVLIAGVTLVAYFKLVRIDLEWRRHWRHYLVIGTVNSAIPFSLYAYAAQHIPASVSVILNSSAPLFGAVFSFLWLGERLNVGKLLGLVFGAAGVALVAGARGQQAGPDFTFSALACVGAAACYGLAGVYMRKFAREPKPLAIAGASQLLAGLVLLPFLGWSPVRSVPTFWVISNLSALALFCGAVAYLLYYRLIADVGPTRALTVTFLMPVFGMLWGALLLGETISRSMLGGCALIVVGTAGVLFGDFIQRLRLPTHGAPEGHGLPLESLPHRECFR